MKPAVFAERAEQLLLLLESKSEDTSETKLIFHRENGRPMILETVLKHFKASAERAGVDLNGRTTYCLRHTFNTHLAKSISLKQLQTAMGHTTMSSSKRYLHPESEDLLQDAQSIRGLVEKVFDGDE